MSDPSGEGLRLAFFSPVPPTPSGIADYIADLLPLLPQEWDVEVFADVVPEGGCCGAAPVFALADWEQRHGARPFALNIYQVGNGPAHAATLDFVRKVPGLLVLHDAVLHPARVSDHVGRVDLEGYRRAAEAGEGEAGAALAHLVAAGLGSPALYWRFALSSDLARASRLTVLHGDLLAEWFAALTPDADVAAVSHWRAVPEVDPAAVSAWRQRAGGADDTPLIGSFGHIGDAHRLDVAVAALGRVAREHELRVVLVGRIDEALRLEEQIAALGLRERVTCTGPVASADFAALMRAVDIALNLRYPSARSSSGTLQQLMQLGVPTAISDLVHLRDVPDDAVLRVPPLRGAVAEEALASGLATWLSAPDELRRARRATRRWAAKEITAARMASSYRRAVARALKRPGAA